MGDQGTIIQAGKRRPLFAERRRASDNETSDEKVAAPITAFPEADEIYGQCTEVVVNFAAPLWLLALLPWGALTLWLLKGRRTRFDVPFLQLWRGPVRGPRPRRSLAAPPLGLALALASLLLAIVAAADPRFRAPGRGPEVSIIVDRGLSMSALSGGVPRFREAGRRNADQIRRALGKRSVALFAIPGGDAIHTDTDNWVKQLDAILPTADDTGPELKATVALRLAESTGAVIVVSDGDPGTTKPRLLVIRPNSAIENVAIVALAARESPKAQVLVRVSNESSRQNAMLSVTSNGQKVQQSVTLPKRGEQRAYFIDLAPIEKTVRASVELQDDLPADNDAFLARERDWPRVEARTALPPALQRMLDIFGAKRPAGASSRRVVVMVQGAPPPEADPAMIVARPGAPATRPSGSLLVADHPLTRNVREWPRAATASAMDAAAGWKPVVSVGGHALVAVQDDPVRRLWVGMDLEEWSRSSDFVVFCANAFEWLGEGGETFASHPLGAEEGTWQPVEIAAGEHAIGPAVWPGIYRRSDGAMRAFHAPPLQVSAEPVHEPASGLDALARQVDMRVPIGEALVVASLACLLGCAAAWKRSSLTGFWGARTF